MKGCYPLALPMKWQPPIQCNRIPRPIAACGDGVPMGKDFDSYSCSQGARTGAEWLGSCHFCLAVIS